MSTGKTRQSKTIFTRGRGWIQNCAKSFDSLVWASETDKNSLLFIFSNSQGTDGRDGRPGIRGQPGTVRIEFKN